MKNILKNLTILMFFLFLMTGISKAEKLYFSDHGDGKGYWIPVGGTNSYDGSTAETREEMEKLELLIKGKEDYICISPYESSIGLSEEDFQILLESNFYMSRFMVWKEEDSKRYGEKYRIYCYRHSIEDYLKQMKTEGYPEFYTIEEIEMSTVIIDEVFFDKKEAAGKPSDEWGDNLPDWDKAVGYIDAETPVPCIITLYNTNDSNWYNIPLKKGKNRVKVKAGIYYIDKIDGKDLSAREDSIIFSNKISVSDTNGEDHPYELDLTAVTKKYGITDKVTQEYTKATPEKAEFGGSESTVVKNREEEEKSGKKAPMGIIIGIIVFVVLVIAYISVRSKRKKK